ncbi:TetR/AcrR family transcriptional regulator [Pseudomonas berkeleyensis]|uniref:TetR/AcrR family transcriptional regulator n=1 Tax=Pseudomonas berkeleyensis TaxID=2726956 RepID=A0A7G5DJG9_9PSED|nr:TetR/AcrR family transcriptional regulator [Pseudomonas berkeleyensis]QMV61894.1 TetR/AcrR family transcriptional regulator [Pseudomonas berkeleyensis]WSO37331.1 TetR/AcrR family transcriptional regulator [Pseudomonas berkeleyensis]
MTSPTSTPSRRRLPREARTRQLLETSWTLIRDEGTDALTLGRLAEAAGITKPVVYDHFGTRNGLLAALYEDYDIRQTALFDAAVAAAKSNVQDKARVIAGAYVDCVLTQGREIQDVLAALSGSPELAAVKRQYQEAFIKKCAGIFAPFAGPEGVSTASLWAMLGAADALSDAAVVGDITEAQAKEELRLTILGMVQRSN